VANVTVSAIENVVPACMMVRAYRNVSGSWTEIPASTALNPGTIVRFKIRGNPSERFSQARFVINGTTYTTTNVINGRDTRDNNFETGFYYDYTIPATATGTISIQGQLGYSATPTATPTPAGDRR
jgi:hypothetical protein